MDNITCISHPIVKHKLSILRNKNTSSRVFRGVMMRRARGRLAGWHSAVRARGGGLLVAIA